MSKYSREEAEHEASLLEAIAGQSVKDRRNWLDHILQQKKYPVAKDYKNAEFVLAVEQADILGLREFFPIIFLRLLSGEIDASTVDTRNLLSLLASLSKSKPLHQKYRIS